MSENKMSNWFEEEDALTDPKPNTSQEKETPTEATPEQKTEEKETQPDEGDKAETKADNTHPETPEEENIPFHKHPRFKALTSENRELKESLASLTEKVSQFETKFTQQETEAQPIPDWFIELYGENEELYSKYKQDEEKRIHNMEAAIMQKLAPKLQAIEQEERTKATNQYIQKELEAIKAEEPNIDTNAVMKVVYEKKLFDENGNLNFRAGAEWLKDHPRPTDTKQLDAKKSIAGKISTEGSSEPTKSDVVTSQDLKQRDWRSFYKSL